MEAQLTKKGWHLTPEGQEQCMENDGRSVSVDSVIKKALNLDLRTIGKKWLPIDLSSGRISVDSVEGPVVLQLGKLRNISAPKDIEESQAAPKLWKLALSDGQAGIAAVCLQPLKNISVTTPPGSKVLLEGRVDIMSGYLLLTNKNTRLLGGHVPNLVDSWQLKRKLAQQSRMAFQTEGGPPPFVPLGKKVSKAEVPRRDDFKSLAAGKEQQEEENSEFQQQRQATIAEAEALTLKPKTFGGSQKMPVKDSDLARIVEMGFSADQASNALRQSGGDVSEAIGRLLGGHFEGRSEESGGGRSRGGGRGDMIRERVDRGDEGEGGGRRGGRREGGRRGRRGEEDEEDMSSRPSGPATLFDFMSSKIPAKTGKQEGGYKQRPQSSAQAQGYCSDPPVDQRPHTAAGEGFSSQRSSTQKLTRLDSFTSQRSYGQNPNRREDSSRPFNQRREETRDLNKPFNQRREEARDSSNKPFNQRREETRDSSNKPFNQRREEARDSSNKPFNQRREEARDSSNKPFNQRREEARDSSNKPFNQRREEARDSSNKPFNQRREEARDSSNKPFNQRGEEARDSSNKPFNQRGEEARERQDQNPADDGGGRPADRGQTDWQQGSRQNSNPAQASWNGNNRGGAAREDRGMRGEGDENQQKRQNQSSQQAERSDHNNSSKSQPSSSDKPDKRHQNGSAQKTAGDLTEQNTRPNQSNPRSSLLEQNSNGGGGVPGGHTDRPQSKQAGSNARQDGGADRQQTDAGQRGNFNQRDRHRYEGPSQPRWRRGDFVIAKYWEDDQLYQAVVEAVAENGHTAVVTFIEYGNQEEVLCTDILPMQPYSYQNGNFSANNSAQAQRHFGDPRHSTMQDPRQSNMQDPRQFNMQEPRQSTMQDPRQSNMQDPRQSTMQDPRQSTMQDLRQSTMQDPRQSTMQDLRQSTMQDPRQSTMQLPYAPVEEAGYEASWIPQMEFRRGGSGPDYRQQGQADRRRPTQNYYTPPIQKNE